MYVCMYISAYLSFFNTMETMASLSNSWDQFQTEQQVIIVYIYRYR